MLLALATLVVATGASAGAVDPKALVLTAGDIPSGFRLDRPNTGVETNAQIARNEPSARTKLDAWRRVTGYKIEFDRDGKTIASRVDVFRSSRGAQQMLAYFADEANNGGAKGLAANRVNLGAGGWLFGGKDPGEACSSSPGATAGCSRPSACSVSPGGRRSRSRKRNSAGSQWSCASPSWARRSAGPNIGVQPTPRSDRATVARICRW